MAHPRTAQPGEIYAVRFIDGRFGAIQVRSVTKDRAHVAVLDYVGDRPPAVADLRSARVVRRPNTEDAHIMAQLIAELGGEFDDETLRIMRLSAAPFVAELIHVEPWTPWWAELVGAAAIVEPDLEAPEAYGRWWSAHSVAWLQGGPGDGRRDVDLAEHDRKSGSGERIDLSSSGVSALSLTLAGQSVVLSVPPQLEQLDVEGDASLLTVEGLDGRFPFQLHVDSPDIVIPQGCEHVEVVHLSGLRDADAASLGHLTGVVDLTLYGDPGRLSNASVLPRLTTLRHLSVFDLYELDAGNWTTSASLGLVELDGVRRDDAVTLRKLFSPNTLVVTSRLRSGEWITTYLDNPFRDWDEASRTLGEAATKAWTDARRAVSAGAEARQVLFDLVAALNRRERLIETHHREQAADAFISLAEDLGIGLEQAMGWFDEWRRF
jgi:hypothetical protein